MTSRVGPWVLVVGMHRSGTSAVTGALGAMGLGLVHTDDRMDWPESNPEHWESLTLTLHDEDLLRRLDGAWDAPPEFPAGWEDSPSLAGAPEPLALVEAAYPGPGPKVVKDPRLCLLLPYWRRALPAPIAAVLVWRRPLAVARSLHQRDGLPVVDGLALWERYNRTAVRTLDGVDTFVLHYESVIEDRAESMDALVTWLASLGQFGTDGAGWDSTLASAAIEADLRHQRVDGSGDGESLVTAEQQRLVGRLTAMAGGHRPLGAVSLGAESAWATSLLGLRRELSAPRRELDATRDLLRITRNELDSTKSGMANLHASTSWRITGPLRALTTTVAGLRRHRPAP